MKIRDLLGENWKRDAYQRDYDSSRTGFGRPPREDDEYVNGDQDEVRAQRQHMDSPHDVHINGKKWKSFRSHSHASNVAKKIKGATVHKSVDEALPLDQLRQASGYDASKDVVSQQLAKFGPLGKPPVNTGGIYKPGQKIGVLKPTIESATAGATSAANVGVGAVYKNKPVSQPKNKNGTAKNALDMKGANLLGGGSIKR